MKRVGFVLMVVVLAACSPLPKIISDPAQRLPLPALECDAVFPAGSWQLHHAIEATVRGRKMGRLTGVTVISSDDRTLRCALMTLEGLVLFAARYDGRLTVERAVAPFDRPGFGQGLIEDLTLMLFKPPDAPSKSGWLSGGERICRHQSVEGAMTDVIVRNDGSWTIHTYDPELRRKKSVEARAMPEGRITGPTNIARQLTIQGHGMAGYRLELTLIEALQLTK